jgi:nucleotide-binding universal stress UspA family protein
MATMQQVSPPKARSAYASTRRKDAENYGADRRARTDSAPLGRGHDRVIYTRRELMKPIVLATDGSPSAAEATLLAVKLARTLDAPLVAVAVEHVDVPSYGYYGYADLVTEMTKVERKHVDETLAQVKALAAEAGVECDVVHATGPTAEAICQAAGRHNAQMLVIGAHGWGALGRIWHGSVSIAVVHDAPCPVLVVRSGPEALLEHVALHEVGAVQ